jgi:arylsulfatase A-like enzyme
MLMIADVPLKRTFDLQRIEGWLKQTKLGLVLLPWLASAVGVLFAKRSLLTHIIYRPFNHLPFRPIDEIALSLRNPPVLHFWEKASLFRADLLVYFLLVPVIFCLLSCRLSLRWRLLIVILGAFFVEAVVYLEVVVYFGTGAFSSLTMIWLAVAWAVKSHSTAFFYLPAMTVFKIAAMFAITGLAAIVALAASRQNIRWLNHAVLAVFGLVSLGAAVSWVPVVPAMPWTQTLVQMTVHPAFFQNSLSLLHSDGVPALVAAYRKASHVPARVPSAFTGSAKNYNVILFVMEATTAQAFDPARDSLSDMPNVRRLREQSFLMARHYTSYPLTNAAAFSIFTSIYAKTPSGDLIGKHVELPGLIRGLRGAGYETGYYGYVWKISSQRDDRMLSSLGFDRIVEPRMDARLDWEGNSTFYGPAEYTEGHDLQALDSLRGQIHDWTARRQRFAAAFFPEIGHDPYRELSGHTSKSEVERGHELAVLQDAWLGQLLDELQRDGALENTIIVLTADHGMRFLDEHGGEAVPLLPNGKVQDVTMRVPMLIYAPGVLQHSVLIHDPTSHIDITPTLLDLLGISTDMELAQGSSMLNPAIGNRRLFLAMDFLGATGFYYGGSYYSCGPLGIVYKSSTLDFDDRDILRYDSGEAESAREIMAEQDSRQMAILTHVLQGEYR